MQMSEYNAGAANGIRMTPGVGRSQGSRRRKPTRYNQGVAGGTSYRAANEAEDLGKRLEVAVRNEQEIVDLKIAASEARTDAKFAALSGKLDAVLQAVQSEGRSNAERSNTSDKILAERIAATDKGIAALQRENKATRREMRVLALGGATFVVALITLLAAVGPSFFGFGLSVRDMIEQIANSAPTRAVVPE
jgi:hypothetical protein